MPRSSIKDQPMYHRCENCNEHQATMWWVGEGGVLAISRFYMQAAWCDCCSLKAQISYAEERAKELENLRKQLTEVKCNATQTQSQS